MRQRSEGKTRFGGKEEVHGKRPSRMRRIFIKGKIFHGKILKTDR